MIHLNHSHTDQDKSLIEAQLNEVQIKHSPAPVHSHVNQCGFFFFIYGLCAPAGTRERMPAHVFLFVSSWAAAL